MAYLCEDEQLSRHWKLNFGEFPAKVLHKCLVEACVRLYRFFADQLKDLIDLCQVLVGDERSRFQSFLDLGILCGITELLPNLCGSLAALAQIAEHLHK